MSLSLSVCCCCHCSFICSIVDFDMSDPITMLKQGCFLINPVGNRRPNLLDPDKETATAVIILETIKM